jgi:putative flippase GtrA
LLSDFWKYVIVGLSTAVIYGVSLWVCTFFLDVVLYSVVVSYLLAIAFNYLMNYRWTFVSDVDHRLAVSKYLVMVSTGGVVNMVVVWLGLGLGYNFLFVQLFAISVICFFNYVMSQRWVYVSS